MAKLKLIQIAVAAYEEEPGRFDCQPVCKLVGLDAAGQAWEYHFDDCCWCPLSMAKDSR